MIEQEDREDDQDRAQPQRASYWRREIAMAKKRNEEWVRRGRKIVEMYRDSSKEGAAIKHSGSHYNILYSNTETMKGALWEGFPKPDIRRRFTDDEERRKSVRTASEVLERATSYCIDAYDSDTPVERAIEDMLLPGQGQCWIDYEPSLDEMGMIADQKINTRYVYWEDFLTGFARDWVDVPWIARRKYMSRDDLDREFPEHPHLIELTASIGSDENKNSATETEQFKRAEVWEIWFKRDRSVIYFIEGHEWLVDVRDDPLGLEGFFPCPRPMVAVDTNETMLPSPLYSLYQDQANELNDVTDRLAKLVTFMVWAGVYNSSVEGSATLDQLGSLKDGQFVPLQGFNDMLSKGGLEGTFAMMPIDRLIMVIAGLTDYRERLIETIYAITGISDIMRGNTKATETRGAQELKSQFGQQRMSFMRRGVAHFLRDLVRIKAEIIAEHFEPDHLAKITGVNLPMTDLEIQQAQMMLQQMAAQGQMAGQPQQQPDPRLIKIAQAETSWQQIMALLRDDKLRGYAIDVETDETKARDENEEKQRRLEFVAAFQQATAAAYQAAMEAPQTLPLIKEALMFLVRSFKAGRALEEQIEDTFDSLQKQPPQKPQGQQQGDTQADMVNAQSRMMDSQTKRGEAMADAQLGQRKQELAERKQMVDEQVASLEAMAKQAEISAANAIYR